MTGCDYLKNFLQEEGFRYTEEERYISFKYEGTTYFALKQTLFSCKLYSFAIQRNMINIKS